MSLEAGSTTFTVLIPARLSSSRLPNKPLADIAGLPMVVRVARRARLSQASRCVVAADDERIVAACAAHGVPALLTRTDHASGSDRLAEACELLGLADDAVVVNVQGDEPLVDPAVIDAVVQPLLDDEQLEMATACRPLRSPDEYANPTVVKVVHDVSGRALYFSRAPIPHERDAGGLAPAMARAHVGLYAYRRDVLIRLAALPAVELERTESLEQLRALAHGIGIQVVETRHHSIGVDTPEDLARVRQWLLTESRS